MTVRMSAATKAPMCDANRKKIKMSKKLLSVVAVCLALSVQAFALTDSEWIEEAIRGRTNGVVVLSKRSLPNEPERDWWLIDRAILVPNETTILLDNCTIKLSDKCRDNFFRSANCGLGMGDPVPFKNITIRGKGQAVLVGADRPRSTGDSGKTLLASCPWKSYRSKHTFTFGTDAGKPGESQKGDWRNIGILMANVDGLKIENIRIVESHCWAISLEACRNVLLSKLDFESSLRRVIDGVEMSVKNQDGIDLRNGCANVVIDGVTGRTGDDVIALTAISNAKAKPLANGAMGTTHVMHNDWTRREKDIENVVIRNVSAYSAGNCAIVRLLPCNTQIKNIVIENVTDTSPKNFRANYALLLGDRDGAYGACLPDSISDLVVSNVQSRCKTAVVIRGYVSDARFVNIQNLEPNSKSFAISRPNALKNVALP